MDPLTLYNKNAPFSDEQWLLVRLYRIKICMHLQIMLCFL